MDYLASLLPAPPTHETPVKALTYITPGATPSFTYHKIPSPVKKGHVLVSVKAAALNPLDLKLLASPVMWTVAGDKGLGRDFCGIVEEVGEGVTGYCKGDRVCGMYYHIGGRGTIASHILVNTKSDTIIHAPDSLTDEEAAAFPLAFGTAWLAVHRAKVDANTKGRAVVLGGSTATGIFAIQLLKNVLSYDYVVATCSGSSEELVKSLGADQTINYRETSVPDALISAASGEDGNKFNLIIDCIGGVEVYNKFNEILLPRSSGSAYVTLVGDQEQSEDALAGPAAYSYNPKMIGRKLFGAAVGVNYYVEAVGNGDWIKNSTELFNSGKLKVVIDQVANWKDFNKLFEKQRQHKAHGKLVFTIDAF